jgi:hypothetical protein
LGERGRRNECGKSEQEKRCLHSGLLYQLEK